jgi:parallel beta-helix repeat protein
VTVDDNFFSNNDNDGVKIEDSSGHTVTDNTANGNGDSGVAIVGSLSSNTIEKNTTDGNRDGIFVEGNDNTVRTPPRTTKMRV